MTSAILRPRRQTLKIKLKKRREKKAKNSCHCYRQTSPREQDTSTQGKREFELEFIRTMCIVRAGRIVTFRENLVCSFVGVYLLDLTFFHALVSIPTDYTFCFDGMSLRCVPYFFFPPSGLRLSLSLPVPLHLCGDFDPIRKSSFSDYRITASDALTAVATTMTVVVGLEEIVEFPLFR